MRRQLVTLENRVQQPDGGTGLVETFVPVTQIWAAIGATRGAVIQGDVQTLDAVTHRVVMRWVDPATWTHVSVGARRFRRREVVDPDGRMRVLEALVEEEMTGAGAPPGALPELLQVPAGFGWVPPLNITRQPNGTYTHDFTMAPYVITGKAYYLSPTGSDTNDGLSAATPRRSLWRILQDVGDYDVIYLAAGEYDVASGWASRSMSRSASMIATGGRAVISRRATAVSWAADATNPGVWLGTPANAVGIGVVLDARFPDANGQPQRLLRVASIAAVAATPGSYFPVGTTVYVRTQDSRAPDSQVSALHTGVNALMSATVSGYFENIDFLGGNAAFVSAGVMNASRTIAFNNCTFRFASNGDGLDLDSGGDVFLLNCIAEHNERDGLNYNRANDSPAGARVVEIGCIARWNGYVNTGFNNGTTLHSQTFGVTLNCLVEKNQNRNVHDVFGTRRWMIGSTVRDSRATDASSANYVVAQIPGQSGAGIACSLWLEGCTSSGSLNDLVINAGGTARLRNTNTGGWSVTNSGVLESY